MMISVFSHFAASEDPQHDAYTSQAGCNISRGMQKDRGVLRYPFLKHIANTAAVHRYPQWQLDMVRLGIGLYGIDTLRIQSRNCIRFPPSIHHRAIRKVPEGETVSYGRQGVAPG